MDRTTFEAHITKLSHDSYSDGMRLVARMARDLSAQMLGGNLPAVSGPAALQLLATMCDKLIAARDA